jgi:hypothetical protein
MSSPEVPTTNQTSGTYPGTVEKEKSPSLWQRARASLRGPQRQEKDTTQVVGVAEHSPNNAQQTYPAANYAQQSMAEQRAQANTSQQDATGRNPYGSTPPGALSYYDEQRRDPKRK